MKLVRLTTVYPAYAARFYARSPALATRPYSEQKAALDRDAFGWADFWTQALAPHGYETWEIPANVEPLQRAWAREQGLAAPETGWLHAIARAQIRGFAPDVLFLDDYHTFSRDWIRDLRRDCSSVRLVLGWCGAPFRDSEVFEAYDLVLSCIPELVDRFGELGHRAAHLHHAFDPRVLQRIDETGPRAHDFTFIGQVVRGAEMHQRRARMLEELAERVPLTVFTPAAERSSRAALESVLSAGLRAARALGGLDRPLARIPRLAPLVERSHSPGFSARLRGRMRPAVYGLEMFQTLRDSRVTFNNHIDLSAGSASNMRLFESTGVGSCLLTDRKPNLGSLFEPDQEVVAYGSTEECAEKVRWLLEHEAEREEISRAGQARVLREHTFAHRAPELDALIRAALP